MLIPPDGWGLVGLLICNASSQVKGGGGGGGGGGEGEEEEEEEERGPEGEEEEQEARIAVFVPFVWRKLIEATAE